MKLQSILKRDWQLYKRGIIPALVLTAVFFVFAVIASSAAASGGDSLRAASVALVDSDGGTFSQMAVGLVSGQDFVSQVMEIRRTDEEAAMNGLENGKYAAVIVLPKGYVDAIMGGDTSTGRIILSDSARQYSWLIRRLAAYGQELVLAGQLGVFTGQHILRSTDNSEPMGEYVTASNVKLLSEAMKLQSYAEVQTVTSSGVSAARYTLLLYLAALTELCALFFVPLFTTDMTGEKLFWLRSNGLSFPAFLLPKIIYPAVFRVLAAVIISAAAGEWALIPGAVCAAVLSSVWTGLLLAALPGRTGSAILSAAVFAGFALLGGIVPQALLPSWAEAAGRLTPVGAVLSLLTGTVDGKTLLVCAGFVLFAAAAAALRIDSLLRKRGGA